MLALNLLRSSDTPLRVLALGAHSDDLEIGCGATLAKLAAEVSALEVTWVVFSGNEERQREAQASAEDILAGVPNRRIELRSYRDGFFPYLAPEIKEYFETLKAGTRPDLIFTHRLQDRHQDHRTIADLTWNTFRDHCILEYEIPKADADLGNPGVYVQVSEQQARQKVERLIKYFGSQRNRHWFCEETFLGLMRLRGLESGASARYAEAFHARKLVLTA